MYCRSDLARLDPNQHWEAAGSPESCTRAKNTLHLTTPDLRLGGNCSVYLGLDG